MVRKLHRKLEERARANHRSIEDEAAYCLRIVIETEDETINAIPQTSWDQIEKSICETIHDKGTPLTDSDFERYRKLARGRKGQ